MKGFLAILITAICLSLAAHAQAAPLSYSSAETVSLTSPSTTFTITTGSVADSLTINATSVQVTLSSSTDGTFALTSASYNLSIAISSGGGVASLSCGSGVASVVISQSTSQANYTITPTASQCTTPSGGGGSGGGGASIGVASAYGVPYIRGAGIIASSTPWAATTLSVVTSTVTSISGLQAEISALSAKLASLRAQAGHAPPGSSPIAFTRNLSLGMTGTDVTALQEFLISQASGSATAKLKAHGITQNFGTLTFNALKELQKKAGITPASGYFGSITRAYVNSSGR